MNKETLEMIKELEKRGWKVIRLSEAMKRDMDECVELDEKGEIKDCLSCSCNVCLMQM